LAPPQQVQIAAHVEVIQAAFLETGIYLGSFKPEFLKDLGLLMVKYKLRHIQAVLIPCANKKEEVIRIEIDKKEDGTEKDEEKAAEEDDILKK
jgi:hypothetical protein